MKINMKIKIFSGYNNYKGIKDLTSKVNDFCELCKVISVKMAVNGSGEIIIITIVYDGDRYDEEFDEMMDKYCNRDNSTATRPPDTGNVTCVSNIATTGNEPYPLNGDSNTATSTDGYLK